MAKKKDENGLGLWRAIRRFWRSINAASMRTGAAVRNRLRRWRRIELDYLVMSIGGTLPERDPPRRGFVVRRLPLPSPPLSLELLNLRLQAIGDAGNVRGVILVFQGFQCGLATIQSFRCAVERLKAAGKEVIVFTPFLDLRHYYAAVSADMIVVPPESHFDVIGLNAEVSFLKDAMQQVGVEMDVVQISPYKTAFNTLQHSEFTEEHQAQLEWLLDDQYDTLAQDMAADRGLSVDVFKGLIDNAPYSSDEALANGLVDRVGYEDQLPAMLASPEPATDAASDEGPNPESETRQEQSKASGKASSLKIRGWAESVAALQEVSHPLSTRHVGVVSLEGLIMMGTSRKPPIQLPIPLIGGELAGEQTIVSLLRKVEKSQRLAALVFHVDSGGGSAQASDLIARQIQRIARDMPVVVYMGDVAASGGYYVSAHAQHIVAQPLTITGSIGVIMGRPSTEGLYEKLQINRVNIQRGRRADLYSDRKPMTVEERELFKRSIDDSYRRFKQTVAQGRDLPFEELDPLCEGRVWTGRQALENGLVDSHGDLNDAIKLAAELGKMRTGEGERIRVVNYAPRGDDHIIPTSYSAVEEWRQMFSLDSLKQLSGQVLWLMPYQVTLR